MHCFVLCISEIIPSLFLPTVFKQAFVLLVALVRGREHKGSNLLSFALIIYSLDGNWNDPKPVRWGFPTEVSPPYLDGRSMLCCDCLWAGMPAAIGRCRSSKEMWIHTFLCISDLLKQPPWDISSWVVDEHMLVHPSDAVDSHVGSFNGIWCTYILPR